MSELQSGDAFHPSKTSTVPDSVAVVTSRGTNTGAFRGERFEADEWTTDVFVRDGDRWRCVLTQLTPVPAPQPAAC